MVLLVRQIMMCRPVGFAGDKEVNVRIPQVVTKNRRLCCEENSWKTKCNSKYNTTYRHVVGSGFIQTRIEILLENDKKNGKCIHICVEGECKTILGKNSLSTPDRDLNLDLPVIGCLVYYKSRALDPVATEAVSSSGLEYRPGPEVVLRDPHSVGLPCGFFPYRSNNWGQNSSVCGALGPRPPEVNSLTEKGGRGVRVGILPLPISDELFRNSCPPVLIVPRFKCTDNSNELELLMPSSKNAAKPGILFANAQGYEQLALISRDWLRARHMTTFQFCSCFFGERTMERLYIRRGHLYAVVLIESDASHAPLTGRRTQPLYGILSPSTFLTVYELHFRPTLPVFKVVTQLSEHRLPYLCTSDG
uniref:Uncharacterized protein n=1 Tax=Timema bartmani TaxID=61472 RepID=A0A7R9ELR5_9NEOP|nr:unnamed protein product [Timema bartmani]